MDQGTEQRPDVAGTWRDWPAIVLFVVLVIGAAAWLSGGKPPVWMWIVGGVAAIAWVVRAGALTPRRR